MTRAEREQLIERYLSGEMSGGQEENFFIEVAANRELRQELKAYRVVEQGMAEESQAISSTYSSLRTHIQGVLVASGAGTATGGGESGSASGGSAGAAAGSGGGGIGSLLGGMTFTAKWIIGSLAVAGITVGTLVLDPFSHTDETRKPSGQTVREFQTGGRETAAESEGISGEESEEAGEVPTRIDPKETPLRFENQEKTGSAQPLVPSGKIAGGSKQAPAFSSTDSTMKEKILRSDTDSHKGINLLIGSPKQK